MDETFQVYFSHNVSLKKDFSDTYISIEPTSSGWNDFIFKTHSSFQVFINNELVFEDKILVAVQVNNDSDDPIEYVGLGNIENNIFYSEVVSTNRLFFSLLPSIGAYRNLIKTLGTDLASKVLKAINDLVYLKDNPKLITWMQEILSSDVFSKSFMRNSEPFFAFHNAENLIKGLEFEEFGNLSNNLNLSFKLDGYVNNHSIDLKFSSDGLIPKRINILIGENGTGKSQALNHFVRASLQQRNYANSLIDHHTESGRPMISRLLAIGTPGETNNTYPKDSIKNSKLNYRRLILTRNSRPGESLVQLVRVDESIREQDRWGIFLRSIDKAIPLSLIRIKLKNKFDGLDYISLDNLGRNLNEERQLELWSNINSGAEPMMQFGENVYPMSSGQLSFFKFALLACLNIENGSFVLLDEPETHLHPSLISDFVSLLDTILEQTGSYALIATHSPYFVREVAREQVHVFKRLNGNEIQIVNPRLKTFGANIGDISYFVFDEDEGNALHQLVVNKVKRLELSYTEVKEKYQSELSTEMLHLLKESLGN